MLFLKPKSPFNAGEESGNVDLESSPQRESIGGYNCQSPDITSARLPKTTTPWRKPHFRPSIPLGTVEEHLGRRINLAIIADLAPGPSLKRRNPPTSPTSSTHPASKRGKVSDSAQNQAWEQEAASRAVYELAYKHIISPRSATLSHYDRTKSDYKYGEVDTPLIYLIIELAGLDHTSLFIDVGCGVANVLIHICLRTLCRCVGVELRQELVDLALELLQEVRRTASHCGHRFGDVRVLVGDFLDHENILTAEGLSFNEALCQADAVFVNNFTFGIESELFIAPLQLRIDIDVGPPTSWRASP